MPVPKRKVSRSRRDKRSAGKGLKEKSFTLCTNCEEPLMPHQACLACGFYRGRKVLTTKADRVVARRNVAQKKQAHVKPEAQPEVVEPAQ